jgi:hypothetical protein
VTAPSHPVEDSDETAMLIGTDVSRPYVSALAAIDEATPRAVAVRSSR